MVFMYSKDQIVDHTEFSGEIKENETYKFVTLNYAVTKMSVTQSIYKMIIKFFLISVQTWKSDNFIFLHLLTF